MTSPPPTLLALLACIAGCGARTGLNDLAVVRDAAAGQDTSDPPECTKDSDCDGFDDLCSPTACDLEKSVCHALAAVNCADQDPCTQDLCDPTTGKCSHPSATMDNDKDGHKGPLPGHAPGDVGSCGDDCDDTSPLAYPGGKEACDGVDNDCNGVVDDNASFVPTQVALMQVDGDDSPASPGGLAWSGSDKTGYMATYTGTEDAKTRVFMQRMTPQGQKIGAAVQATLVAADATGGSIVWTGDRYGMVWEDRRNGDYEVYFNQFGPDGAKVGPDLRITDAYGFSVYPQLSFNGLYYLLVWQDEHSGQFEIMSQRVDLSGNLVDTDHQLTNGFGPSEAPAIAVGTHGVGIAWAYQVGMSHEIWFGAFSHEFAAMSPPVKLSGSLSGVYPSVVWNKKNYVVAWYDRDEEPHAAYGAVVDESGKVTVPAKRLTNSPKHSRFPTMLPLGDRLMMVYSDDRDQNNGYEIYARMLTDSLGELSEETRITNTAGDSVYAVSTFGPAGDMGILFRDDFMGAQHVYFTRLQCMNGK